MVAAALRGQLDRHARAGLPALATDLELSQKSLDTLRGVLRDNNIAEVV